MIHAPYRLTELGAADMREIIRYTRREWGIAHATVYKDQLHEGMVLLANGQGRYRDLGAVQPGVRSALCQRHYIFGLASADAPMMVLAVLHERMELIERLKARL